MREKERTKQTHTLTERKSRTHTSRSISFFFLFLFPSFAYPLFLSITCTLHHFSLLFFHISQDSQFLPPPVSPQYRQPRSLLRPPLSRPDAPPPRATRSKRTLHPLAHHRTVSTRGAGVATGERGDGRGARSERRSAHGTKLFLFVLAVGCHFHSTSCLFIFANWTWQVLHSRSIPGVVWIPLSIPMKEWGRKLRL